MQYKRSIFIINKKFQLKFAFFVCTWIFALSMVYPIVIYNIFEFFLNNMQPGATAPTLTPERIKDVQNQIVWVLGALQILFMVITFIISIFLSHRIAGPLYKLRRAMDDVSKGNLDQRITFRKNDHFTELQDSFNDMVQTLGVRRSK